MGRHQKQMRVIPAPLHLVIIVPAASPAAVAVVAEEILEMHDY